MVLVTEGEDGSSLVLALEPPPMATDARLVVRGLPFSQVLVARARGWLLRRDRPSRDLRGDVHGMDRDIRRGRRSHHRADACGSRRSSTREITASTSTGHHPSSPSRLRSTASTRGNSALRSAFPRRPPRRRRSSVRGRAGPRAFAGCAVRTRERAWHGDPGSCADPRGRRAVFGPMKPASQPAP